jgi:hypothetical protein
MSMLNEFVEVVFTNDEIVKCRIVDLDQGWVKLLGQDGSAPVPTWVPLEGIQYMRVYEPERDRRPAPPAAP